MTNKDDGTGGIGELSRIETDSSDFKPTQVDEASLAFVKGAPSSNGRHGESDKRGLKSQNALTGSGVVGRREREEGGKLVKDFIFTQPRQSLLVVVSIAMATAVSDITLWLNRH